MRRAAAALFVLVTVLLAAVHAPGRAEAAITTPFAVRFDVNTNGSILLRGNSNLTCPTLAAGCAAARDGSASGAAANNNSFTMAYTDTDGDLVGTFNDSTTTFALPAGSSVLFAGLYWGADSTLAPTAANRNKVLFRTPATTWQTVTATSLYASGGNYQGFADVTSLVAAGGDGKYGVANIQATLATGQYAGWSLAIAYRNPAEDLRSLRIYDGFGSISSGSLIIPISGFETPHSGVVHARIGAVAYEGDRGTTGDSFNVDGTALSDGANPANNFFNSTATDGGVPYTGRDPPYANLLGFDVDQVQADNIFGHAATSTTLTLASTGDAYYPGVITFSIDLYAPKIVTTMTSTDVNGGDLLPGDEIEYRIAVQNDGSDTADGVVLSDAVPPYTSYVPGSLTVQGTPVTDAADADGGSYAAGTAGWKLGSIPYAGTTYVTFRVKVAAAAPAGYAITNLVNVSYTGHTTSVNVTGLGGAIATPVRQPHPDRAATLTVTPDFVQRAAAPNAITYTATVTNTAGDLEPAAGAQLTLPAGVTPGTLPAGCTAAGQVVTCSLGPLAAGTSGNVSVPALADATTATTAVATVQATGTGADGNPANDTDTAALRVNSPPVAQADTATTSIGTPVTVPVRSNDTDPEDPVTDLLVSIVTPPAHGSALVEANQTVTYTPAAKWGGADTFTYQVDDQHGGTATAVATVTTANAGPVANDDAINTDWNNQVTIRVLDNDSDPNDDPLTVTAVTQPPAGRGTVSFAGNLVTFTPDAVYHGTAQFDYTIDDGNGGTATATVTVNVENAAPTAADDVATVPYAPGTPVLIKVTDNDTDPNLDHLTVTAVGPPTPASASLAIVAGGVELTTVAGFSGDVTFSYTISDGNGGTATAQATVTVRNAPPVAATITDTTPYRTALPLDVVAAGSDPNNDQLRVSGVTDPANGTVVRTPTGKLTYLPDIGFSGVDTFSYTLDDGNGGTATATVTVTVGNGVADAQDDFATAVGGTSVVIDVLANDVGDPNGDPLTMTTDVVPLHGSATIGADQRITYVPVAGFVGTDSFHYQLDDGNGGVTGATVTVTVINLPPVAQPDAATTDTDVAVTIPVLNGDSDPNGDPLTVTGAVGAAHGTVTVGPGDTLIYTPAAGFCGTDSFLYTITDPSGLADSAIVTVTVRNAPPVAVDDRIPVWPAVLTTLPLLANDHDANTGQVLRISSVTGAGKGTVALSGSTVTYRSLVGATGTDTFTYELTDGAGGTATGTVTIVINSPPSAVNDNASTSWATAVDIPVTANDTDPDLDLLTVFWLGSPQHGVATLNADGTVHYLPDPTFVGTDFFGYQVRDPAGNTSSALVTVVVSLSPPMAVADRRSTPYRRAVTIPVLANDVDSTQSLQVKAVTQPARGTVTFTTTSVTYTPPDGFSGVSTFDYTAMDLLGNTATAQVEVTVGAPPALSDKIVSGQPGAAVGITPPSFDNNGLPITIRRIGSASHGTAVRNGDGTITYTPDPGFAGTDSFTYEVVDADGNMAEAWFLVSVPAAPPTTTAPPTPTPTPTPTPSPTALPPATSPTPAPTSTPAPPPTTPAPSASSTSPSPFPSTSSGNSPTASPAAPPSNSTPTSSPTASTTPASPPASSPGTTPSSPASTTPTATSSATPTATPTATLTAWPPTASPPTPPTIMPPPETTSAAPPVTPSPVKSTTPGPTTTPPTTSPTTLPRTPPPSAPAAERPPIAANDTAIVITGDSVVLDLLQNDRDPDGDAITLTKITKPVHGDAVASPDGMVTYRATGMRPGMVDSFGYTVGDGRGGTASATVTIRIRSADALPVTGRDAYALIRAGLLAATAGGILHWLGGRGPEPEESEPRPN